LARRPARAPVRIYFRSQARLLAQSRRGLLFHTRPFGASTINDNPAGYSRTLCRSRPAAKSRGTIDHRDGKSAFQASSSITLGSSPSCIRLCASHTSRLAIPLRPPKSTPPSSKRSAAPPRVTPALRYAVSNLRAKGLVAKLPNSRRYQLLAQSCLVFLNIACTTGGIAELTAGLLSPVKSDARLDAQSDPSLTVSICVSSMISTRSSKPSALKLRDPHATGNTIPLSATMTV
jgi:hypothetical protein